MSPYDVSTDHATCQKIYHTKEHPVHQDSPQLVHALFRPLRPPNRRASLSSCRRMAAYLLTQSGQIPTLPNLTFG